MTEKRRGRPPKGSYVETVGEAFVPASDESAPESSVFTQRQAQAYANRVWSGQSPDVKHAERIARVKRALAGQNLPFEGVVLP